MLVTQKRLDWLAIACWSRSCSPRRQKTPKTPKQWRASASGASPPKTLLRLRLTSSTNWYLSPPLSLNAFVVDVALPKHAQIRNVGFHNKKVVYLQRTAQILIDEHNNDVPRSLSELVALPGVGLKMAHLTLQVRKLIEIVSIFNF